MSGDTITRASSTTTSSSPTGQPSKSPERRLGAWALALGYTALLFTLLWGPPTEQPPLFPHDDKVFHALAFSGIGASWWWATHRVRIVWSVGIVLAVGTEVVQSLLPWPRAMDPLDMLADLVGVAAGLIVARRIRRG